MLSHELKKAKDVELSHTPISLKLIDNEVWSCQSDGITVYDEKLKRVRTMEDMAMNHW